MHSADIYFSFGLREKKDRKREKKREKREKKREIVYISGGKGRETSAPHPRQNGVKMNFKKYLVNTKINPDSPEGDFVGDFLARASGPVDFKSLKAFREYLESLNACEGALRAGVKLFKRYEVKKKAEVKRKVKAKPEKVDGLGPDNIRQIRTAIRQVWTWSHAYRLAKKRNIGKDGFPRCEQCRKKVPKTYVDHLVGVGAVDSGFIARMFVPSSKLQNLCKKCHQPKTNKERAEMRRKEKEENFF